jgi:hypothetical protein
MGIALNLLKQERTAKVGIKAKRLIAGWHQAYLPKALRIWMQLPGSVLATND